MRVLVVDDHEPVRVCVRQLLENGSHEVVGEAADGAEAVRRVEELRPQVVVMDIQMPVMDGIEATRRIAARFPGVRVLAFSTFDDLAVVVRALEAGAAGYLLKNDSGTLAAAVSEVGEGRFVASLELGMTPGHEAGSSL